MHHLSKRTVGLIEEETVVKITDCPKFRIICRFGIVFGCQEYLIFENHRDYIDETGVSICKIPFLTTVRIDGEYAGFIDTNCGFVVLLVVSYGKINRTVRIYRRCAGTACLGTVVAELIRIVDIAVKTPFLITFGVESGEMETAGEGVDHAAISIGSRGSELNERVVVRIERLRPCNLKRVGALVYMDGLDS